MLSKIRSIFVSFGLLLFSISGGLWVGYSSSLANSQPLLRPQVEGISTEERSKTVGEPVEITIGKIGIKAAIEKVGLTSDGRMDVPADVNNGGWYMYGAKPGEFGSSVIAGHLDTNEAKPALFYRLGELSSGDEIQIRDRQGNTYRFVVERTEVFEDKSFPLAQVFAADDKSRLNLITCYGNYDSDTNNYDRRMVVFSTLKRG